MLYNIDINVADQMDLDEFIEDFKEYFNVSVVEDALPRLRLELADFHNYEKLSEHFDMLFTEFTKNLAIIFGDELFTSEMINKMRKELRKQVIANNNENKN